MAHVSDPEFLVLHGNKLKGFSESDAIGAVVGIPGETVVELLAPLRDAGFVLYREGRLSGWMVTPTGRAEHAARLTADVEAMGTRQQLDAVYQTFLGLNGHLLRVCTAWQVRDLENNVLNDHSDPDYDASVVDRLGEIHDGVRPVCEELEDMAQRFGNYRPRFSHAIDRVRGGEGEWFAKPLIDSYHTVWMELHEDLLASLRIDRASEPSH